VTTKIPFAIGVLLAGLAIAQADEVKPADDAAMAAAAQSDDAAVAQAKQAGNAATSEDEDADDDAMSDAKKADDKKADDKAMPEAGHAGDGAMHAKEAGNADAHAGGRSSRISDERVISIDPNSMPKRPPPIIELGPRFLGTGVLTPGVESPTGEVLKPQLVVFGAFRTAVQSFNDGNTTRTEWANQFNLFANLALSYTNRILIGFSPLDRQGRFTGVILDDPNSDHYRAVRAYNGNVTTAFFEGDLGEMFPGLDRENRGGVDYGFAVGRQPLSYQDGMLINDTIDSIGITRNNTLPAGGSNLQLTFVYGWNEITSNDNKLSKDANLYGLFTQADYPWSSLSLDLVYVDGIRGGQNGFFWGLSGAQRIGKLATTFRVLGSHPTGTATPAAAAAAVKTVDEGYLLFSQINYSPAWTENNLYLDAFWGIDNFTSAARAPAVGGPLGNTGILFASFGIGNFNSFGAALGNRPESSAGAALGYQIFSHDTRRQYIVEVGARDRTDGAPNGRQVGVGMRFQQAIGQRYVLRLDGYGVKRQNTDMGWGARVEFMRQF
jgi:hypothetical protein